MHTMGPDNHAHLERVITRFSADLRAKYQAGQEEHGGEMWLKSGMLEHAYAEALDLVCYLATALEQQERLRRVGHTGPVGLRPLSQAAVKVGGESR